MGVVSSRGIRNKGTRMSPSTSTMIRQTLMGWMSPLLLLHPGWGRRRGVLGWEEVGWEEVGWEEVGWEEVGWEGRKKMMGTRTRMMMRRMKLGEVVGRWAAGQWGVVGRMVVGRWGVVGRMVEGQRMVEGRWAEGQWMMKGRWVVGRWVVGTEWPLPLMGMGPPWGTSGLWEDLEGRARRRCWKRQRIHLRKHWT